MHIKCREALSCLQGSNIPHKTSLLGYLVKDLEKVSAQSVLLAVIPDRNRSLKDQICQGQFVHYN